MKKLICTALVLAMCVAMTACSGSDNKPESSTATTTEEKITAKEQLLVDLLIEMVTEDFFEPSAVRVLDIGDYVEGTATESGPDRVVVRLQGENRVGGTLNNYYKICLTTYEDTSDIGQSTIKLYETNLQYYAVLSLQDALNGSSDPDAYTDKINESKAKLMDYKGEAGEYVELSDDYEIAENASDDFNIGRINKALTEYWEELGF